MTTTTNFSLSLQIKHHNADEDHWTYMSRSSYHVCEDSERGLINFAGFACGHNADDFILALVKPDSFLSIFERESYMVSNGI